MGLRPARPHPWISAPEILYETLPRDQSGWTISRSSDALAYATEICVEAKVVPIDRTGDPATFRYSLKRNVISVTLTLLEKQSNLRIWHGWTIDITY